MKFTYSGYQQLLKLLNNNGYELATYHNWNMIKRCVILRHDIDTDIKKAVQLARLEEDRGAHSTYFVLLTSDFYNVYSKKSKEMLKQIVLCGHEIGLHFDEVNYPEVEGNLNAMREKIIMEADLLEKVVEAPVKVVSMHRPSKEMLDANLEIPGMINSYGKIFFRDFKYLSDSRRRWREKIDEIVKSGEYNKIHICTHAFWYYEQEEDIQTSVKRFVNSANIERYESLRQNITDIDSIMKQEEVK